MGHALQTSGQAIYGARHAGLNAGIPQEVPMLTLNRLCGSGAQSIVSGSQMIMLGEAEVVVAGGAKRPGGESQGKLMVPAPNAGVGVGMPS